MADLVPAGPRAAAADPPPPRSIAELTRVGVMDAELAATLWVLLEGRVPVIVATEATDAPDATDASASTVLDALLDLVGPDVARIELAGEGETFDWLPQAPDLGWHRVPAATRPAPVTPATAGPPVTPATAILVARDLAPGSPPTSAAGEVARIAIRAASIGYGLVATVRADGLDTVFEVLRRPPIGVTDDELSRLGVVLVLARAAPNEPARVTAAHYVRPVVRDEHGHVQRLGPAVLATWDPANDRFEHFGWGITPELALRVGRRAGDFEIEVDRRRAAIDALATSTQPVVTPN